MDDELKMKCYIWTTGLNRLTISGYTSSPMKGAPSPASSASRRIYCRALVSGMVLLVMLLPLIIFRISFLVLEPATARSLDCTEWSFFGDIDPSLLRDELTRTLVEVSEGKGIDVGAERSLNSFEDLVKDITSGVHDIKTFALKAKSMLSVMEHEVQTTRQHELVYWNLASHGVPRSLHCLCLILAEEYAINAMARSRLPSPEYVSRLSDPSFQHLVLLTDNVLAASVVVSSTIENSDNSENLVFHIVTDKKTYTPMHTWFAINHFEPAVVEVKGLHQYDWPQEVNVGVKEMLEIHNLIWNHYYNNLKEDVFEQEGERPRSYEMLSASCLSLMNHLRIYLPELFPDLGKVLFLDDDVVVQRDLSPLWGLDLNGSVVGAVINSWCGHKCCTGRRYGDYFNFSNPIISSNLDHDQCGWSYGVNVFDLDAWRRSNITKTYHNWLKLSLNSGFELWYPGLLSPSLVAFEGYVHPIDPLWHVAGLGSRSLHVSKDILEAAAVIHFSGPAKPWLEIGFPEVRSLWNRYVNSSNEYIKKCGVMG